MRINTFHMSHLTLSLFTQAEKVRPRSDSATAQAADEAAVGAELRSLTHEVLLLLALFALGSPRNAEALRWRCGSHPTMLHRLCDLPFSYFSEPRLRGVLMPTLICACLHDMVNLRILQSRLSPQHVIVYLRSEMASHQQAPDSSATSLALATLVEDPSELPIVSMEYGLAARLSPLKWADALTYL